jgi:flagellar assembly protein FliH
LSNVIKSLNTDGSGFNRKLIDLKNVALQKQVSKAVETVPEPIRHKAEQIIREAEEKAAQIQKQAAEEYERHRKKIALEENNMKEQHRQETDEAREQGHSDGYAQGLAEGKNEYNEFIHEAKDIVASTKAAYHRRLDETQYDIVGIAVKIAGKITRTELAQSNDRWVPLVQEALKEVKGQEEIRLYVHHRWYDLTVQHKSELMSVLKHAAQVYIYPESEVNEHMCIIETPYGRMDASVDSQLGEIKKKADREIGGK